MDGGSVVEVEIGADGVEEETACVRGEGFVCEDGL